MPVNSAHPISIFLLASPCLGGMDHGLSDVDIILGEAHAREVAHEKTNTSSSKGTKRPHAGASPGQGTAPPPKKPTHHVQAQSYDSSDDESALGSPPKTSNVSKKSSTIGKEKTISGTRDKTKVTLVKDALLIGHPLVVQPSKEPPLAADNAVGRYVLVPANVFGCDNPELGGWIGKILKIEKNKDKSTTIKFKDKTLYFKFDFVLENFKTLT